MDSRKIFISLVLIFTMFSFQIPIDVRANDVLTIAKAIHSPVIDGRLDDPVWRSASVFTEFKTIQPDYGLEPSEKTVAYVIYDCECLYLGFSCQDSEPDKIKASVSKRDNPGGDDWIAFCLDTFNDELGCYFFLVNPLGIQTDGTLNADAEPDVTLDMIWTSAGRMTDEGYNAEMAIPFESLRYPDREPLVMGFKMARNISRKSEEVDFPEYHPEWGAALAQFQKIHLSGLKANRILEIIPATTASRSYEHQEGELTSDPVKSEPGITGKIGLTSDLILDATINPDFSQVETDAGQIDVNLRYALYYPEKRPFFLEGQNRFTFAANPENTPLHMVVHTRTIIDPDVGLKLNGRISKRDFVSTIYAKDTFNNPSNEGQLHETDHVSILRYVHRWKNDSYLGGFFTGRNSSGSSNEVIGLDGRIRFSSSSILEYHAFGSFTREYNETPNRKGTATSAYYVYRTRQWNAELAVIDVSSNFHTEVGYLTRRGVTQALMYLRYTIYPSSGWIQQIAPYYWGRHGRDHESGLYETFNVFSLGFSMPRQSSINLHAWLANEIYGRQRFSRNTFRLEGESQILKQLFLECDLRFGKYILYDPETPYQGRGVQTSIAILHQPTSNISLGLDIVHANLFRDNNGEKVYDYTIYRNRTVFQLNKYLFFRSVLEYNTYRKQINADFLVSFTYIPGTVLYLGYGSIYEKLQWNESDYRPSDDYLLTNKTLFFKASYLLRM